MNNRLLPSFLSFRMISLLCALLIFAFGVLYSGIGDPEIPARWIILSVVLYAIPCMLQLVEWKALRIYSMWFGLFIVLQQVLSPLLKDQDFKTLPSNMDSQFIVTGSGLPGIHGSQRVTTDSKGFRVFPHVNYEEKNGIRIFAIGGSTTEQLILDDRSTWAFLLQEGLNYNLDVHTEVINTGVSGLRARHHLPTLRHVLKYRPDMALFLLGINDWNKDIRVHFGSREYRTPDQYFRDSLLGNLLSRVNEWIAENSSRTTATTASPREQRGEYYTSQNNSLAKPDRRRYFPARVSDEYAQDLESIATTCKKEKIACVFITQPTGYSMSVSQEYSKSFWMTPPNEDYTLDLESLNHISSLYNRYLHDFGERHGFHIIDLASHIEPSHENFYDDAHYNTNGSNHVANVLVRELTDVFSPKNRLYTPMRLSIKGKTILTNEAGADL